MNNMEELQDQVDEVRKPLKECPLCGGELETKLSFKGRSQHRNKRKTQVCKCGWSRIIPTDREALTELGLMDDET